MKNLTKCPKCGSNSIFLEGSQILSVRTYSILFGGAVDLGRIIIDNKSKKIKALCNKGDCSQKFWLLPSGIITRRNA